MNVQESGCWNLDVVWFGNLDIYGSGIWMWYGSGTWIYMDQEPECMVQEPGCSMKYF